MRNIENEKKIGQGHSRQRGAVVVEFALMLIPLLMVVSGIIEFGRTFWYYDALIKGTRDGARFLSTAKDASAPPAISNALKAQAQDIVVNAAVAASVPGFSASDVEVECAPDCNAPVYVTVSIDAYPVTIGGWIPVFIPLGTTTWGSTLSPYTTMRYMR